MPKAKIFYRLSRRSPLNECDCFIGTRAKVDGTKICITASGWGGDVDPVFFYVDRDAAEELISEIREAVNRLPAKESPNSK